jgi:hypothetical protein
MNEHTYRMAAMTVAAGLALTGLSACGSSSHDDGTPRATQASTPSPGSTRSPGASAGTSTGHVPSAAPTRSATASASPDPSPTASAPLAADGYNTKACFDGTCEVAIPSPMTIAVDSRFGFSHFKVTHIGSGGVTVEASAGGTFLQSGVSPGGTAGLNGLSIRVKSVTGHTAILVISPAK